MKPALSLDDHRTAQADALAHAGADEQGYREAGRRTEELAELLDAATQRAQAEALAEEQARVRVAAEARARRLAIEKARAEQAAEVALRARLETEELACAEARRKEQALVDLATASAARVKRETEIDMRIREKLAAERAALEAAHARIQSEQTAETLALARVAIEQEAARIAALRLAAEQDAALATAAHHLAATEAATAQQEREAIERALADLAAARPPPAAAPVFGSLPGGTGRTPRTTAHTTGLSRGQIGLLMAACLAIGALAGGWIGANGTARSDPGGGSGGQLKLETRLAQPTR